MLVVVVGIVDVVLVMKMKIRIKYKIKKKKPPRGIPWSSPLLLQYLNKFDASRKRKCHPIKVSSKMPCCHPSHPTPKLLGKGLENLLLLRVDLNYKLMIDTKNY
jgi:hypothetical protein